MQNTEYKRLCKIQLQRIDWYTSFLHCYYSLVTANIARFLSNGKVGETNDNDLTNGKERGKCNERQGLSHLDIDQKRGGNAFKKAVQREGSQCELLSCADCLSLFVSHYSIKSEINLFAECIFYDYANRQCSLTLRLTALSEMSQSSDCQLLAAHCLHLLYTAYKYIF